MTSAYLHARSDLIERAIEMTVKVMSAKSIRSHLAETHNSEPLIELALSSVEHYESMVVDLPLSSMPSLARKAQVSVASMQSLWFFCQRPQAWTLTKPPKDLVTAIKKHCTEYKCASGAFMHLKSHDDSWFRSRFKVKKSPPDIKKHVLQILRQMHHCDLIGRHYCLECDGANFYIERSAEEQVTDLIQTKYKALSKVKYPTALKLTYIASQLIKTDVELIDAIYASQGSSQDIAKALLGTNCTHTDQYWASRLGRSDGFQFCQNVLGQYADTVAIIDASTSNACAD